MTTENLEDRLRFIKHKGHAVYLIDFSRCSAKELLLLLDQIRVGMSQMPPASVLVLADFTDAEVDKHAATRMKEVLTLDRPFVKRSAWVGTDSLPHVYYENFKTFSQREIPTFKTKDEALDWLVKE
jgi:hypothetical protein